MNTSKQIPAPTVTDWGYWGTMQDQAEAAWPIAMKAISDALYSTSVYHEQI